jgi:hypothetical protein
MQSVYLTGPAALSHQAPEERGVADHMSHTAPSGAVTREWRRLATSARRLAVRSFYRALYRDSLADTRRCMLIAGTARSGTTWLGELIASQVNCRLMFEPFQPHKVPAYRQFEYFQYLRPEQDHAGMEQFCTAVFTGRIRNRWIDQEVTHLRPGYRLVKEIRANLLLGWIARRFPEVPRLFIVRHPCAVVQSRLQLGWATDTDIASFLAQPDLVDEHLAEHLDLIRATRTDSGKHALIWCISNLVPLRQFASGGLPIVYYEDLVTQPAVEIPRVFRALGQPYDDAVFDSLAVPSTSTRGRSGEVSAADRTADWRRKLDRTQVDEILAIVDAFGLGHLYGDSPLPRSG